MFLKNFHLNFTRGSLETTSSLIHSHIIGININCQLFVINKQEAEETVAKLSVERHTDLLSGQLNKLKYIYGLI